MFPTSAPARAHAPFLRGVLLLYSFEYDDAIAAFREAERAAPDFALAYWGEALSYDQPLWYNEDVVKGRAALARLAPTPEARAAKAPTAREKGYVDAVERLFGTGDRATRHRAYAERMATLVRDYPNDDEVAVLYALALLSEIPQGERRPDISLKAGAIAATVLKKNPQHPGAAHYVLHAYDDGEHNAMGLDAARIYAKIAPASSHALHMPSHAFLPLGLWDEAAKSDEASFAASVAWVKRTGRSAAQQDFHSLSWLHYEYLQQGRFTKARELEAIVKQAIEQSATDSQAGAPHHVESEIGRGWAAMSLRGELASMRARDVVESRNWPVMKGQARFDNIDELFALGLSSVGVGDLPRADAALADLRKAASSGGDRDLHEVAAIMADELSGVLAFAHGDRARGLDDLARAAKLEAQRPKPIARPYPIKPAAELYGEFLIAAGDARAAVQQFENSLARTPRRAASLLGLAAAASITGNRDDAVRAAREFLAVWHAADRDRLELEDARRIRDAP